MVKVMAAQQQQQHQQQQQSKQHMYKLPAELQNMVNFYTPTKDILQSREAQEMLMGMCIHFFFFYIYKIYENYNNYITFFN